MQREKQIRHKIFGMLAVAALMLLASLQGREAYAQTYYSVGGGAREDDDQLRVIDPTTAATISSVTITLTGKTVKGGNGLATHPFTQQLWALLRIQDQVGGQLVRELVTIDPITGVATSIGNPGDNFAGIEFDATGTLFGLTGDGAAIPETLFILSQTDATPTFFLALGKGDDGEVIAFNRQDRRMYHLSGLSDLNDPGTGKIFEAINLGTSTVTSILLSGSDVEALGFMYDGADTFLYSDLVRNLFRLTTGGVETFIGTLDHTSKGLARVNAVLPFATFTPEVEIKVRPGANNGKFEVEATFTLGAGSDGIAPLTEDLTLQVGPYSTTIPAGSFKKKKGRFKFEGVIDGVRLAAKIRSLRRGGFGFEVVGQCADLTGIVNAVTVGLAIGNDGGSTDATAEIESSHRARKCGQRQDDDKDDDKDDD